MKIRQYLFALVLLFACVGGNGSVYASDSVRINIFKNVVQNDSIEKSVITEVKSDTTKVNKAKVDSKKQKEQKTNEFFATSWKIIMFFALLLIGAFILNFIGKIIIFFYNV